MIEQKTESGSDPSENGLDIFSRPLYFDEVFGSTVRVRVLKVLVDYSELNISAIVKKLRMNNTSVKKHLAYLVKAGLVQEKKYGRIKIYRFREENPKARALKNLVLFWENK